MVAMLVLLVCDVIGGFIALASGAESLNEAWGFETDSTVPLPVAAVQVLLAWLAARDVRPPVGVVAAVLLSAFCLLSVLAGLFDGDLIGNVASEGILSLMTAGSVAVALASGVILGEYVAQPVRREAHRLESRLSGPRLVGPLRTPRRPRRRPSPSD